MTLALLALIGLAGGVGITAIGPGGVLPTIGLFALTGLTPAQVAGTSIVTHIATGALATAAYSRSGQLREPGTRRTALILAATAALGTPVGVLVNRAVSQRAFGVVLGLLVAVVAALVLYRERRRGSATQPSTSTPAQPSTPTPAQLPTPTPAQPSASTPIHPSASTVAGLGLAVAVVSGVVGIGGPMLTVPLLIVLGVPVLESLASAQVQSIVIATVGTLGYLATGAVDWPLAALVGIPELAGVLLGWKIARSLPTVGLKYALIVTLFALAPYLALHG